MILWQDNPKIDRNSENIPANDPLLIPEQRKIIDEIILENKDKPGAAMVVLGEVQSKIGWVSEATQAYLADKLEIPVSTIHGVVTFYSLFSMLFRCRFKALTEI